MSELRDLIRQNIMKLKPYSPGKPIEEVKREYGITDIVKLASNENPLGPSPQAVEAMKQAVEEVRLYPDNDCFHLRRELAEHVGFSPEEIIVGRGSDEVIHMIGLAFIEPGDQVIVPDPCFTLYDSTTLLMDGEPVRVLLKDYRYDLPAMAEQVTDKTKVVFIANPNNPTGTYVTQEETDALLQGLPDRVIVVFDEAYFEYVDCSDFPKTLEYVRAGRKVIVLRTFSKIYALAGLRIGYGIASEESISYLNQVREPFNISSIAQAAARASLKDPEQVKRSRDCNAQGKKYLYAEFERLGLPYIPTHANFVSIDLLTDCRSVFTELLKRGVIVRTGDIFGMPTHIRVTIGKPEENQRFITCLEEVLAQVGSE